MKLFLKSVSLIYIAILLLFPIYWISESNDPPANEITDPDLAYELGLKYKERGFPMVDLDKSYNYFSRAQHLGDKRAMLEKLDIEFYRANLVDCELALQIINTEWPDSLSPTYRVILAKSHLIKECTSYDPNTAEKLLLSAADDGHAGSYRLLKDLYYTQLFDTKKHKYWAAQFDTLPRKDRTSPILAHIKTIYSWYYEKVTALI